MFRSTAPDASSLQRKTSHAEIVALAHDVPSFLTSFPPCRSPFPYRCPQRRPVLTAHEAVAPEAAFALRLAVSLPDVRDMFASSWLWSWSSSSLPHLSNLRSTLPTSRPPNPRSHPPPWASSLTSHGGTSPFRSNKESRKL